MIRHLGVQHCTSQLQTEFKFTPAEIAPTFYWSGDWVARRAGLGVGTKKTQIPFWSGNRVAAIRL